MNRIFPFLVLATACGVSAAACSSGGHLLSDPQKTCALVSACGSASGPFGGLGITCEETDAFNNIDTSQLGSDEQTIVQQLKCVDAASDCAAVQACTTVPAAQASVCAGSTMPRCSGNYLVDCGSSIGGMTQGQDCSAAGLICVQSAGGATCATAACDPATTQPSCDGDKIVRCEPSGGLVSEDCALNSTSECSSTGGCHSSFGGTCSLVGDVATCTGTGAACDVDTYKASCDGTTVVTCAGGKVSRVDCTSLDPSTTCVQAGDGTVSCAGAGKECTENTPESCAKGVITYCMWGTKATLDCTSYGLSGCAVSPGSMPAQAHCTP